MSAWFYLLRLRSQGLYCGSTKDLQSRLKDHFSRQGARTTRIDPPLFLAYSEDYPTFTEAFHREQQVKRWSRAKKEALIKRDYETLKRLSKRKK